MFITGILFAWWLIEWFFECPKELENEADKLQINEILCDIGQWKAGNIQPSEPRYHK